MAVAAILAAVVAIASAGMVAGAGSSSSSSSSSISYTSAALADEIVSLPGLDSTNLAFRHFSGYLTVDETAGRTIFYWFVTSESAPATDPLVLWTNGGPGCSGFIGLLSEMGPFQPTSNLTLETTDTRWNLVANMLYIETPSGVGFSYSKTTADYKTGDDQTATDNYNLILAFFERYPHLVTNDFYIASESYGGHYMPQLGLKIVKGNLAGVNQAINFKGLLVGNPYLDPVTNSIYGEFPTYWGHQLVSTALWNDFQSTCIANGWEGEFEAACDNAMQAIYDNIGDLDPYALDFPMCASGTQFEQGKRIRSHTMRRHHLDHRWGYEECVLDYMTEYLAQPAVMTALHVNTSLSFSWQACSDIVDYSTDDADAAVESQYLELVALMPTIKLTIMSGDDDSVCATVGTQHALASMGLSVLRPWTPWYLDEQVGGYVVWYEGITFITVHTAGHMIAQTQPARGLSIFENFLAGTLPGYDDLSSTSSAQSSAVAAKSAKKPGKHHALLRHQAKSQLRTNADAEDATALDATTATTASESSVGMGAAAAGFVSTWSPSRLRGPVTELPYSVPRATAAQRRAAYKSVRAGRRRLAALRGTNHAASSKVLQPDL